MNFLVINNVSGLAALHPVFLPVAVALTGLAFSLRKTKQKRGEKNSRLVY